MNKTVVTIFLSTLVFSCLYLIFWSENSSYGLNAADSPDQYHMPQLSVDDRPIQSTEDSGPFSYADMLEKVTPAIVGVYTTRIVTDSRQRRNSIEEYYRRYFGLPEATPEQRGDREAEQDAVERRIPAGVGSGVLVSSDGFILTNNHVLTVGRSNQLADEIRVQLTDGREYEATVIGADERTDIAVIKIDADLDLPYVTLANSDQLRVGDVCFAIGNPFEVGLTVTRGIVSGTGRTDMGILGRQGYEDFIQTDAAINMGNSGGALVDAQGRLIGINTAILSRTGGNIGIGFAIPVNMAQYIMTSLIDTGAVSRGYLGVVIGNMDPDLAESFGLDTTRGALIRQVEEGGAADEAGIRHGDIVLKVDGRNINSAAELRLSIAQKPPGERVAVEIFRGGERTTKQVVLGDLEAGLAAQEGRATPDALREPVIPGLTLRELTPDLRETYSIPDSVTGVLVYASNEGSALSREIPAGTVIAEVNDNEVRTTQEIKDALTDRVNRLYVWYEGRYDYVTYRK